MSEHIITVTATDVVFERLVNERLKDGYSLHGEPSVVKVHRPRDNYGQKQPAMLVFTQVLKKKDE